jgi:tetratricopeptide (TPR) repeat protein
MARTALDRAERLFAAGRYAQLVSLLEPQVPVYRESLRFYYLLGSSCLRSGDPGGAMAYLKRAQQIAPSNPETMLALAALSVRRGESEKAIEYYLAVLEDRPGDKRARSALAILRKEGGPEGLARLLETGKIEKLYPGNRALPRFVLPLAISLALIAAVVLAWPLGSSLIEAASRPRVQRPEVAAVALSKAERDSPLLSGGSYRYLLTEKEALSSFERAKDYFQSYRDNAAMIEINRLLGSNASDGIKEKARSLRSFVGKPDFRTIKDAPTYAQAIADPGLYDGCSVAWKGMAANVRVDSKSGDGGQSVLFDFLVGYQDKKRLEGLVAASIGDMDVPMDRALEILATIRAGTSGGASGGISLTVAAIHELSPHPEASRHPEASPRP